MEPIYMYHCFYYTEDDEYNNICDYNHEIVFFSRLEDAKEYQKMFESDPYMLGNHTEFSGRITIINETIII